MAKREDPQSERWSPGQDTSPRDGFARRMLEMVAIALVILLAAALLWYAVDVLLLVFAGILIGILLRAPSDWLSERTGLPAGWSLGAMLLALVTVLALIGWLMVPSLLDQSGQLFKSIPRSLDELRQRIADYEWGAWLVEQTQGAKLLPETTTVLGRATSGLDHLRLAWERRHRSVSRHLSRRQSGRLRERFHPPAAAGQA